MKTIILLFLGLATVEGISRYHDSGFKDDVEDSMLNEEEGFEDDVDDA